jgi:hypothetical protein
MATDENASVITAPQIVAFKRNTIITPLIDFGRLRRRAGARAFFSSPLLRYGSSERDDGRDGRKPMNTKIMCRRLVDPPRFHLANDRQFFVICGIFAGNSDCQPRYK